MRSDEFKDRYEDLSVTKLGDFSNSVTGVQKKGKKILWVPIM